MFSWKFLSAALFATVALAAPVSSQAGDTSGADARHDWSGGYFGLMLNGGGGGVDVRGVGTDGADLKNNYISLSGVAGYNFMPGPFVVGLEGEVGSLGLKDTRALTGMGNVTAQSDWNADVALRAGYAFDDLLLYVKGGVAMTGLDISSSLGGSSKGTRVGAVAGVGAEYALNANWSVRGELDLYGFRTNATLAGASHDLDLGEGVARIGVMMKF